jgi:hypothetical protein
MMAYTTIVNCKSNLYDGNCHDMRDIGVKSETEWAGDVKRLLRAEMARRGVTYEQLSEKLSAIGIADSAVNIRNRVARGKFTATFLVQCLVAMGVRSLRIADSEANADRPSS